MVSIWNSYCDISVYVCYCYIPVLSIMLFALGKIQHTFICSICTYIIVLVGVYQLSLAAYSLGVQQYGQNRIGIYCDIINYIAI